MNLTEYTYYLVRQIPAGRVSTYGAVAKAHDAQHSIILIDGNKLVDLMHQYGVGVQVSNIYEVKEVDEDFFEKN